MGIVGIERFNRAEAASGLELGGLVDATANECRASWRALPHRRSRHLLHMLKKPHGRTVLAMRARTWPGQLPVAL